MAAIRRRPSRSVEMQVQLRHPGLAPSTLLVRAVADTSGEVRGYVVTFDDVTELLSAQRKAAWADVARRIAHEIKNPLTPIQLAAERLSRKYLKQITNDPETFKICTDTIIRQVADIGRMVDEFSGFARMPQPVIKPQNISDLIRQAIFLQSSAHSDMKISVELPPEPLIAACDGQQISQVLTNLLQNAVDAIEGRLDAAEDEAARTPGIVSLQAEATADTVIITIDDNGKGLPTEDRHRLTEPYVTTRTKGTGLGLAIVKKIMEDHGGLLDLTDRPGGGARVTLVLPVVQGGVEAIEEG
jgi:two-component system nitrogen regulation sensor histidine kinase NtrY